MTMLQGYNAVLCDNTPRELSGERGRIRCGLVRYELQRDDWLVEDYPLIAALATAQPHGAVVELCTNAAADVVMEWAYRLIDQFDVPAIVAYGPVAAPRTYTSDGMHHGGVVFLPAVQTQIER